ncbi:MAG TPA: ABC transporter substrate-binding protein, partial [Stellaceae bacterium]|nr:ABC transporter substrate-binding protein [Stellaceae bacterium]
MRRFATAKREVCLMLSRRSLILSLPASAFAGTFLARARRAAAVDKTVTVGISLPFTGADAHDAQLIKEGALLAIDDANAKGGVAGYKIE